MCKNGRKLAENLSKTSQKLFIQFCPHYSNYKYNTILKNSLCFRLSRSSLLSLPAEEPRGDFIAIENWTKWQIYVRQKPEDAPKIIYARTGDNVSFQNKVKLVKHWSKIS